MILALALSAALVPSEADLLAGIAMVESHGIPNPPDGDLNRPLCQRSRGMYQVRPIAVRELVRVGLLKASEIPGFSLTNCSGIRKWLAVPHNNYRAGRLTFRLMMKRARGDVELALCAYNAGPTGARRGCVYAGQVLMFAAGEGE